MKGRLAITLLAVAVAFVGAERVSGQDCPGVQTITAENITAAGITRVADILLLADNWDLNTTDGFSWKAVAGGLDTWQQQQWDVFLNGHKLDRKLFDMIHLNLLGVALEEIDSVQVGTVPCLHQGEYTAAGFVHIFTSQAGVGLRLTGAIDMGNETGDPGPYRYTEFTTHNVDRIGPGGELTLMAGRPGGYERATVVVQQHPFTDGAMYRRTHDLAYHWPGIFSVAPTVTIGRRRWAGWQELRLAYSHSLTYYQLSEQLGFETPLDVITADAGLTGWIPISDRTLWRYRWNYSSNDLVERPNRLAFDYDWRLAHSAGNLEVASNVGGQALSIGAGLDHYRLFTQADLSDDDYLHVKAYASAAGDLRPDWDYHLGTMLAGAAGEAAGSVTAGGGWRPLAGHRLNMAWSLSRRLPEAGNTPWFWMRRGYDFYSWVGSAGLDDPLPRLEGEPKVATRRQLTGDLTWYYQLSRDIGWEAGASYRRAAGLALQRREIRFNPANSHFPAVTSITTGESFEVIGLRLKGSGRIAANLNFHLAYRSWTVADATPIARDQWRKIPRHKLTARLTWIAVPNLSLWVMLTKVSSTTWEDYQPVDGVTCRLTPKDVITYRAKVPSWICLDVQARKWFWRRRLSGSLLLRNLLDRDVRYHPIGGTFHLTLFIKIHLFLDNNDWRIAAPGERDE